MDVACPGVQVRVGVLPTDVGVLVRVSVAVPPTDVGVLVGVATGVPQPLLKNSMLWVGAAVW